MIEIGIPDTGNTIKLKDRISELNPEEWLYYCSLIDDFQRNRIYQEDFTVFLIYKLLGLNPRKQTDQGNENIAVLSEHLQEFFYDGEDGRRVIDTHTVINLLPTIEHNQKQYQGPGDLLQDVKFGTFVEAYRAYRDYTHNEQKAALPYLTDELYSGGGELLKLPNKYHLCTLYFFRSCVEHITTEPVHMAGEELRLFEIFNGSEGAKEDGLPMDSVLFDVGENGVFGSVDKLKEQNLFEVLRYLWRKQKQNVKEKARAQSNRS